MSSPPLLPTYSRFGDLRLEMGFVVMGLWGVLGNEHKEQFIVSSMNDFLKMSLVRMPGAIGRGCMGSNKCTKKCFTGDVVSLRSTY